MGEEADRLIEQEFDNIAQWAEELTLRDWDNIPYNRRGNLMSTFTASGIVSYVKENPWKNKVFYTIALEDGGDDDYFQLGEGPDRVIQIGDHVEFQWSEHQNGKYINKKVDLKTLKVSAGATASSSSAGEPASAGAPSVASLRKTWGFCHNRAINFVGMLLEQGIVDKDDLPDKPKQKVEAVAKLVESWSAEFVRSEFNDAQLVEIWESTQEEETPDFAV